VLKERRGFTGLFPVLHHVPQLTAGQFPAQLQQFSDINIDLNAVRLALAARFTEIIGRKREMGFSEAERIV